MIELSITAGEKQYPVFIGKNNMVDIPAFIEKKMVNVSSVLIITDDCVGPLYLKPLTATLSEKGYRVESHTVASGEQSKSINTYNHCLTRALEAGLNRQSLLIALGGGVIGDLTGFVAATYMRGIRFIQCPTTLLAHDSAVGGKVGINHPLGKNMIGSFYQPEAVFFDLDLFATLPDREWRSGFAELIKHALLDGPTFFAGVTTSFKNVEDLKTGEISPFLQKGIQVKAKIVAEDEREKGSRAFLNLGHTLAHALEGSFGYGKISHGEAVVIGMVFDLIMSKKVCGLDFDIDQFKDWLRGFSYLQVDKTALSIERLLDYMSLDKKNKEGFITTILLEKIGIPKVAHFSRDEVRVILTQFLAEL